MPSFLKTGFIYLTVPICFSSLYAQKDANNFIASSADTPNIVRITADSLILASGTTYRFTVDTPEDQGLVSTALTVEQLSEQLVRTDGLPLEYSVHDALKNEKITGGLVTGDLLFVSDGKGKTLQYHIGVIKCALAGKLSLHQSHIRAGVSCDLTLDFIAGQRSPKAKMELHIPAGIRVTMENTTVNVIGRGEVTLGGLAAQSIGRTGTNYSYKQVGQVTITGAPEKGQTITFSEIDLRPLNGIDMRIKIKGVQLPKTGTYTFKAKYVTSEPEIYASRITPQETATLTVVNAITDFARKEMRMFSYDETPDTYTGVDFRWTPSAGASKVALMQSLDQGRKWTPVATLQTNSGSTHIAGLEPDKLYAFRLDVEGGANKGNSNIVWFHSGKMNVREYGVKGDGIADDTDSINAVIARAHRLGGATLLFPKGTYNVRTVYLKSNVWLYVDREATIQAITNSDEPEPAWFSDKAYRSGLSPTDPRPYQDPENYLTKQDVGHTFFHNTMFFAERENNIKVIGNGRITGNGILATGDGVINNAAGRRADKMFTFKLCTNIEIGGFFRNQDLWYDPAKDEPYYIAASGEKDFDTGNMLHIDRGGHFVLLATGTDSIHVHNTYFAKAASGNARDIYDFMACGHVVVTNIYSKVSSDDIVKLGSDCSLGFTRPVRDYMVRNIIGDTNCNLFQIGSETANDIQDVYVDNIYVLGANKAGFSISTNDGAHVKNICLNSGRTGKIHSRSVMLRTRAPFFLSISNRGRVIGADVSMFTFTENGVVRKELLCTNSDIGKVENIFINGVDISEVYAGSSFSGQRWKPYDGTQGKATPIIAGYALPDNGRVEGGLNFLLPNGQHTGYITNLQFTDVHLLVKGGHPVEDANAYPPELGVGKYNVGDLRIQPAYGFWARHVKDLLIKNCSVAYEQKDERYAIALDDVVGATIETLKLPENDRQPTPIKTINSQEIVIR